MRPLRNVSGFKLSSSQSIRLSHIYNIIYINKYIRQKYAKQWLGHKVEFSAIGSDHLPKAIHRALWQP